MESITEFELLPQQEKDGRLFSKVLFAGKLIPYEISGICLAAQYRCSMGFLLITDEDTPYEEGLHITLLSRELGVLDTVELSHSYTPGSIRNLRIVDENVLEFTFFGGDNWRLTVLSSPQRWSLSQLTPGVVHRWRRLINKGNLSLLRMDLP